MIRYSGAYISFPSDNVSPKEKLTKKWQMQIALSSWARYCTGATFWGFDDREAMQLLRLYSDGRQPNDKYKDWFDGQKKITRKRGSGDSIMTEYARKGYANVDYKIDSPAPSFKATIQSVLSNSDYRVRATSLTSSQVEEKKQRKYSLYFESKYRPLREKLGLPVPNIPWEPRNKEELELYDKLGGIKLAFEIAIEDICQHVFDISDWKSIRLKGVDDIIDLNFACGKVYTCLKTGVTKIKHVKPQNLIMSWIDEDSDRPTFVAHTEKVRLSDVKAQLLSEGYTLKDLEGLAQKYHTQYNYTQPWMYFREYDPNTERWRWEDIVVDVMEYEYCSLDTYYYTKREAKNGVDQYLEQEERVEKKDYSDGRKRKTEKIPNTTIYEGKFIIGSTIVYGYNRQTNVMKDDKYTCHSSYFFERISGKPITERLVPIYDSLMLGRLKLQAAKWAAAPKGFSIDIAALSNISIGDSVMTPLELIKIRRQNGIQLYKSVIQQGKVITQQGAVQELDGGIGPQLNEWIASYQHDYSRALELSGISQLLMGGSSVSAEKGLGVGQMEVDATNHALHPLKDGLMQWKDKAAKCIVMKTILNIRFDESCREYWVGVIGADKVKAILDVGQTTLEELSIKLESLPSDGMKMEIRNAALTSMNAGKNGQRGISMSDYMYILQMLENGQDKLATWYMAVAEERASAKDLESQKAMQESNAQMLMQSAQAAEQTKVQAQQALAQIEIQKHAAMSNIDLQKESALQKLKDEGKLQQITLEATLEAQLGTEVATGV